MAYNDYLNSDWWTNRKETFKETKSYKKGCLICGCHTVDAHHLSYNNLYKEQVSKDLIFLCRKHHYEFHEWLQVNNQYKYGDVKVWILQFYPNILNNKRKKGIITNGKKHTTEFEIKKKNNKIRRFNILLDILNKINSEHFLFNKGDWKKLCPLKHWMLDEMQIQGNDYCEKLSNMRHRGVNKQLLINFLVSQLKLEMENNEII